MGNNIQPIKISDRIDPVTFQPFDRAKKPSSVLELNAEIHEVVQELLAQSNEEVREVVISTQQGSQLLSRRTLDSVKTMSSYVKKGATFVETAAKRIVDNENLIETSKATAKKMSDVSLCLGFIDQVEELTECYRLVSLQVGACVNNFNFMSACISLFSSVYSIASRIGGQLPLITSFFAITSFIPNLSKIMTIVSRDLSYALHTRNALEKLLSKQQDPNFREEMIQHLKSVQTEYAKIESHNNEIVKNHGHDPAVSRLLQDQAQKTMAAYFTATGWKEIQTILDHLQDIENHQGLDLWEAINSLKHIKTNLDSKIWSLQKDLFLMTASLMKTVLLLALPGSIYVLQTAQIVNYISTTNDLAKVVGKWLEKYQTYRSPKIETSFELTDMNGDA